MWARMYHLFIYKREEHMEHYHKRSNIETAYSMIKGKFGSALRYKSDTGQINEALCKVLAHNICVLVQAIHELGIEPISLEAEEPAVVRVALCPGVHLGEEHGVDLGLHQDQSRRREPVIEPLRPCAEKRVGWRGHEALDGEPERPFSKVRTSNGCCHVFHVAVPLYVFLLAHRFAVAPLPSVLTSKRCCPSRLHTARWLNQTY